MAESLAADGPAHHEAAHDRRRLHRAEGIPGSRQRDLRPLRRPATAQILELHPDSRGQRWCI